MKEELSLKPGIVLVHSPYMYIPQTYGNGGGFIRPPLGVASLSAYLKQKGFAPFVYDLNIKLFLGVSSGHRYLWDKESKHLWMRREKFFKQVLPKIRAEVETTAENIIAHAPDLVCFSVYKTSIVFSLYLAGLLKEKRKDISVILGGPECKASNAAEIIDSSPVDAVVVAEGEETLNEIVHNFRNKRMLIPCRGGFFRSEGKIIFGGHRPFISEIDKLPLPDFSGIIDDYYRLNKDNLALPILWLRGCTNKCTFCSSPLLWGHARSKSPQVIFREFKEQSTKYGISRFIKNDSILSGSAQHIDEVCDLLIKNGLAVQWGGSSRIDDFLRPELLTKMRKAGCMHLSYGIESGSQKIIDAMNKNFSLSFAREVLSATKRAGIRVCVYIMYGYPGESLVDFFKTIAFLIKNRRYIDSLDCSRFGISYSLLAVHPAKYGISLDKNGRYRPRYYFIFDILTKAKGLFLALYCFIAYREVLDNTVGSIYKPLRFIRSRFFRKNIP